jgi:hypothetical protein
LAEFQFSTTCSPSLIFPPQRLRAQVAGDEDRLDCAAELDEGGVGGVRCGPGRVKRRRICSASKNFSISANPSRVAPRL